MYIFFGVYLLKCECLFDSSLQPGRIDMNCPRVCGHAGAILDIKWSPFNDHLIASSSDDATVSLINALCNIYCDYVTLY